MKLSDLERIIERSGRTPVQLSEKQFDEDDSERSCKAV